MVGSVFVGIGAIIANAENICNLIIKFDSKILAVLYSRSQHCTSWIFVCFSFIYDELRDKIFCTLVIS